MILNHEQQHELEQFYYEEAELLDEHRYEQWLELFTDDIRYWMPIRQTRSYDQLDGEFSKLGEMAYFDDDHDVLAMRVRKLFTGYSWAEDPPSRTRHLYTNIRAKAQEGNELTVSCNFILYRTRLEDQVDWWVGRREDVLRREDDSYKIARRSIFLDQTNILSKNLSNFF
jgi:biphenyl 2,3-dioxygenase beta subunit